MDALNKNSSAEIAHRQRRVATARARLASRVGHELLDRAGQALANLCDPGQHVSSASASLTPDGHERHECPAHAERPDVPCQVLAAQEAERKRIAADLHDGLGQLLGAAKFGVESALCALDQNANAAVKGALMDVTSIVKQALDEVRRIAMNLRPSTLDDLGILATLTWFLREFRSIYGNIKVETVFAIEESDVPDALKVAIFRVVQEAMSNVAKHSSAASARVRLDRCGNELHLAIEDDGIGFCLHQVASRRGIDCRIGHHCMRERVESSGGTFRLEAAPGKGVSITISWAAALPGSGTIQSLAATSAGASSAENRVMYAPFEA